MSICLVGVVSLARSPPPPLLLKLLKAAHDKVMAAAFDPEREKAQQQKHAEMRTRVAEVCYLWHVEHCGLGVLLIDENQKKKKKKKKKKLESLLQKERREFAVQLVLPLFFSLT